MIRDERTRSRARAHLERVRARRERQAQRRRGRDDARAGDGRGPASGPVRPLLALGVVALAFGLGAAASGRAADTLAVWLGARRERIESIAVLGTRRLSPRDVARATGVAPGSESAGVSAAGVVERLRAHPWVADAHALRLPTGDLVVEVEERQPRAVLQVAGSDGAPARSWWVDAAGTPFAAAPPDSTAAGDGAEASRARPEPPLPRLETAAPVEPGRPDALVAEAVALAERTGAAALALPAEGSDLGWVLRPRDADVQVVLGRESLDERLARWEELRAAGALERTEATRVDLRFEDQAVLR